MNRADELPPLHLLILARLLAAGDKGVTPAALGKDLKPLVEHRWSGPDWTGRLDRAIGELESSGAIGHPRDKKGKPTKNLLATDDGRRLALEALGIEGTPPGSTWATIRVYLVALALGRPGPDDADVKRLTKAAPGLKAEILLERYDLTIDDRLDLARAKDATAAKLLGLGPDQPFKKDQILRTLLGGIGVELPAGGKLKESDIQTSLFRRELGDPKAKSPLDLIVARSVGARQNNAKELTDAFLRSWIDRREPKPSDVGEAPIAPSPATAAPIDLPAFARRVLEAARSSPGGWFGDDEVFIAHVWRALDNDPAFRSLDAEGFKARLIEAHRARLIELGRADLVEAMDPVDVRESATPYLNAVYHFVRTEDQSR